MKVRIYKRKVPLLLQFIGIALSIKLMLIDVDLYMKLINKLVGGAIGISWIAFIYCSHVLHENIHKSTSIDYNINGSIIKNKYFMPDEPYNRYQFFNVIIAPFKELNICLLMYILVLNTFFNYNFTYLWLAALLIILIHTSTDILDIIRVFRSINKDFKKDENVKILVEEDKEGELSYVITNII